MFGIVFRSCVGSTRPASAEIASTSGSGLPITSPSRALEISIRGFSPPQPRDYLAIEISVRLEARPHL